MNDEGRVFGQGINFPPRLNEEGRWAWSTGAENVRQSIKIIIQTAAYERLMLPGFGGGLQSFLFQPNIVETQRLIEEAITNSLERWESRIKLKSVDIKTDAGDPDKILVTIKYSLIASREDDELQFQATLKG